MQVDEGTAWSDSEDPILQAQINEDSKALKKDPHMAKNVFFKCVQIIQKEQCMY